MLPAPLRALMQDGLQFQRERLGVLSDRAEHCLAGWSAGLLEA